MAKKTKNKKKKCKKPQAQADQAAESGSEQSILLQEMTNGNSADQYPSPNVNGDEVEYGESDDEGTEGYRPGGYHPVNIGEVYHGRYGIIQKLGWGHFSTVWLALDYLKTRYVAIKFQKSAPHYVEAAYDEIDLLLEIARHADDEAFLAPYRELKKLIPDLQNQDSSGVVQFIEHFEHEGPNGKHVAMVFEVMGPNLLTLIKRYNFKGIPIGLVRRIATHVLVGLDYLHRVCNIIHTDLKPENVLVTNPELNSGDAAQKLIEGVAPLGLVRAEHHRLITAAYNKMSVSAVPLPASETKTLTKNQKKYQKKKEKKKQQKMAAKLQEQRSSCASVEGGPNLEEDEKTSCASSKTNSVAGPPHVGDLGLQCGKAERANGEANGHVKEASVEGPPFVRPQIRPSRSDPSLMSTFVDPNYLLRMPYHHLSHHTEGLHNECLAQAKDQMTAYAMALKQEEHQIALAAASDTDLIQTEMDPFHPTKTGFRVVDLGNACWVDKHFSEDIQTRQYRSPEVIMGAGYDTSADLWSLACMIFELLTGDYLFDPKAAEEYCRDEDHLALVMELLGPIPTSLVDESKHAKYFFTRTYELRHIKQLRYWPLADVLTQKYKFDPSQAQQIASFLLPMLHLDPAQRMPAFEILKHPWLREPNDMPMVPNERALPRLPMPAVVKNPDESYSWSASPSSDRKEEFIPIKQYLEQQLGQHHYGDYMMPSKCEMPPYPPDANGPAIPPSNPYEEPYSNGHCLRGLVNSAPEWEYTNCEDYLGPPVHATAEHEPNPNSSEESSYQRYRFPDNFVGNERDDESDSPLPKRSSSIPASMTLATNNSQFNDLFELKTNGTITPA
eukprot:Platyproteum_vivax@DN5233_c0_g1_i1.p1